LCHQLIVDFFFSSSSRHTRLQGDWSSDVCSSDLLIRARRLEKRLGTPAHLYYKTEFYSPTGSHKVNTALAQAWYAKQEGYERLKIGRASCRERVETSVVGGGVRERTDRRRAGSAP